VLHPKLDKYFEEVEQAIRNLKDCNVEYYYEEVLGYKRINLKIRIRFENGNLFEISEAVIVENNMLKHLGYCYHYQNNENQLLFRYDNTPHHPEIETFPHHKHILGKIIKSQQPSIANVVSEITNQN